MATGAVIGALRVVLGADTAALEKGLRDAQNQLQSFANAAKAGLAALGITATVAAFENAIKGAIDSAAELAKVSQQLGVPVEELSKLQYAAQFTDVSLQTLTTTLRTFDKGVAETAGGSVNTFSKALADMGIKVTDANGNVKSQTQLLSEVADKFASYQDGVAKSALASVLFGKSAADMIPFLNQGAAGINKLKDEADAFGVTVSAKTAAAANQFNDELKRLDAISGALWKQLAEALLPSLQLLSQVLIQAKQDGSGLKEAFAALGSGLSFAIEEIAVFTLQMHRLGVEWGAFKTLMAAPFFTPEFSKAWSDFSAAGAETDKQVMALRASFAALGSGVSTLSGQFGPLLSEMTKTQAPLIAGTKAAKDALDSFLDSQEKSAAAQTAQANAYNLSAGAVASQKVVLEAYAIAATNNIPITDALNQRIIATGVIAGQAAAGLDAMRLVQENITPAQQYEQQLLRINAALVTGGINAQQAAQLQQNAAIKAGVSWDIAGASIAGSFATIANSFGKSNSAMVVAAKAFSVIQATLSVYTGMAKALELPFPANLAAAAAVAAQGFAFVAAIQGQQVPALPKFATGGSFRVPGGVSGFDNQLVPLSLAAGERVDISPATNAAGPGSTVNVDMRGGDPYYSRANVEKLINAIHTVTQDGHNVRLVVLQ